MTEPAHCTLVDDSERKTILAVEDNRVAMAFLETHIEALCHQIITAENGEKALEILEQRHQEIDVVLMDREMPVMDGLTAIKKMKASPSLRNIPVIMITGADSVNEMQEGMDAGVFYYLTKPVQEEMLASVLSAAIREAAQHKTLAAELGKHRSSFHLIEQCKFAFRTIEEAEGLAVFMANCFPEPQRVLTGIGELLINAVEHGNCAIGYELKSELIEAGTWRAELKRRQQMPEYSERKATATIAHKADAIYLVIEDEGEGFNWQSYRTIDPSRAGDNHGRGIALANATSFDLLKYNEKGNQAIAKVNRASKLEW